MPARDSRYPDDWFRIAEKDLGRVARRLAEGDVDDAAFRLQQAIEKYLKGFLLAKGWRLQRIHDVEALLSESVRFDPLLERYRALCQQVAGYYVVERYPMFEEGPSTSDVRQAFARSKEFVKTLRASISRPSRRSIQ